MMKENQVICLTKRFPHHTQSGGYDALARYLNAIEISRPALASLSGRAWNKAWTLRHAHHAIHPRYEFADRLVEEQAFWTAWRHRSGIIHALYGDEQIDVLLRRISLLPGKLVLTLHLPLNQIRQTFSRYPDEIMRRLGGVVVVGSGCAAELEDWLGPGKVLFAPHGVDTEAFAPRLVNPPEKPRFLCVGWHMRDFALAHAAIDRCAQAGLDIEFHMVMRSDKRAFFTGCANVHFHSDITEDELIGLYCSADALFLPLIDATANNAILEGLSCGTPVITTRVGSIGDYVDESCGWLLPAGNVDAAFDCLSFIAANRPFASSRRVPARRKAEEFAWPKVASQLSEGYARLVTTGRFAP